VDQSSEGHVRTSEYVAEEPALTVTKAKENEGTESGRLAQPASASLCARLGVVRKCAAATSGAISRWHERDGLEEGRV